MFVCPNTSPSLALIFRQVVYLGSQRQYILTVAGCHTNYFMQTLILHKVNQPANCSRWFSYYCPVCWLYGCPGTCVAKYPAWSAFGEGEEGSLHRLCVWPASGIWVSIHSIHTTVTEVLLREHKAGIEAKLSIASWFPKLWGRVHTMIPIFFKCYINIVIFHLFSYYF